jgi:hypothetical protein
MLLLQSARFFFSSFFYNSSKILLNETLLLLNVKRERIFMSTKNFFMSHCRAEIICLPSGGRRKKIDEEKVSEGKIEGKKQ